ncbi:MAG: glycerol-3-phosphate 1-O-acyltransferase PlsY [Armatimonadota bacterium]
MQVITWTLPLIAAYLLGSVPVGLLIGLARGIDVRQHGSGNIGAANVMRLLGFKWGAISLLGDAVKGCLAVLVCILAGTHGGLETTDPFVLNALGAALAIVGHNWSIFLAFRGGKGIATSLGTCMLLDWRIALGCFGIWLIAVAVTRYASVGSILATAAAATLGLIFLDPWPYKVLFILVAVFAVIRHHANIRRLVAGTEAKLGGRSSSQDSERAEEPNAGNA